jgi:ectoine hydroxylase-related dioxygenase (phytanoyl-CoA dioxygenase family)
MWVPVDPANEETGAIRYIRGSHKWNKEFQPNVFVAGTAFPGSEDYLPLDQEELEDHKDLIQFVSEPGDIIIHHYKTVHGAGGNHSNYQVRRAASLRYCGDDMVYKHRPFAPPQEHHQHTLNDGDTLHGATCFPLVWEAPSQEEAA